MGPIGQLSVKSSSPIIITHKVITTQSCCFIGDPREGAGGGGKDRGGDEGDHHGDGIQPHTPTVHRDAQVTANLVIFILINCSKIFVTAADTVLYFLNVSPEEKIRKKFLPVAIFFLCSRGRTIYFTSAYTYVSTAFFLPAVYSWSILGFLCQFYRYLIIAFFPPPIFHSHKNQTQIKNR